MSDPETSAQPTSREARIRAGLAHLTQETIQAYVREQIIDPTELESVEVHLFDCDTCLTTYNLAFDAYSPSKADFDAYRVKRADQTPETRQSRLAAALESLSAAYGMGRERLLRWRDQVLTTQGHYGAALVASLQAASEDSYVQVITALSAPNLDVAYRSATRGTRRGEPRLLKGADRDSGVVLLAPGSLDVQVAIKEDSIVLEFLDWKGMADPLVLLLPEADTAYTMQFASGLPTGAGEFEVRFEQVPPGTYLLSIAPAV